MALVIESLQPLLSENSRSFFRRQASAGSSPSRAESPDVCRGVMKLFDLSPACRCSRYEYGSSEHPPKRVGVSPGQTMLSPTISFSSAVAGRHPSGRPKETERAAGAGSAVRVCACSAVPAKRSVARVSIENTESETVRMGISIPAASRRGCTSVDAASAISLSPVAFGGSIHT